MTADTSDLRKLAEIAGGNPTTFYVGADLAGVDLRGQDLRGMKFTGLDRATRDQYTLVDPDADVSELAPPNVRLAATSDGGNELEAFRARAIRSLEQEWNEELIRIDKATWKSRDRSIRVVLASSSHHLQSGFDYWYAYHRTRREFLKNGARSFFVLAGFDLNYVVAIPAAFMEDIISRLNMSSRGASIYWHVKARLRGSDFVLAVRGEEISLSEFKIRLVDPT